MADARPPRKAFRDNPQFLLFRKSTTPTSVDHLKTAHSM
jgi:hypothetical protein